MSRLTAVSRPSGRPRFRIVQPDVDAVILPFSSVRAKARVSPRADKRSENSCLPLAEYKVPAGRDAVLLRARALHRNRCCPNCRRGGVIPVDLGDGDDRHWAMPVPGTSTLVGFYCDSCGAEWPA
ncbi:MAG TPA: hypothetical protein VFG04_26425 [Planctomycetaceae bacterium]|nr:hypothetical protein [Planctomycetaceae bacterium]